MNDGNRGDNDILLHYIPEGSLEIEGPRRGHRECLGRKRMPVCVLRISGIGQLGEGLSRLLDTCSVDISHDNARAGPVEEPRRNGGRWKIIRLRTLRSGWL